MTAAEHGTHKRYRSGCRCSACRAANAAIQRAHRGKGSPLAPRSKTRGVSAENLRAEHTADLEDFYLGRGDKDWT